MSCILRAILDGHRIEYRRKDIRDAQHKARVLRQLGAKDFIIEEYNQWGQLVQSIPLGIPLIVAEHPQ